MGRSKFRIGTMLFSFEFRFGVPSLEPFQYLEGMLLKMEVDLLDPTRIPSG